MTPSVAHAKCHAGRASFRAVAGERLKGSGASRRRGAPREFRAGIDGDRESPQDGRFDTAAHRLMELGGPRRSGGRLTLDSMQKAQRRPLGHRRRYGRLLQRRLK